MANLRSTVADQPWADRVHLAAKAAHELQDLPEGRFDLVVLNSVVQYFPSAGYLVDVLRTARRLLAPGGRSSSVTSGTEPLSRSSGPPLNCPG